MVTIEQIPLDVFLAILPHASMKTLMRLRQASKRLQNITNERSAWFLIFRNHIVEQSIPIPDTVTSQYPSLLSIHSDPSDLSVVDELSRVDLEYIVRTAYVCHRRWTSNIPRSTFDCIISPKEETLAGRVIKLNFLKKAGRTYLLLGRLLPPALGIRSLECWDVDANPPVCVALWQSPEEQVVRYCLNASEHYEFSLAVGFSHPSNSKIEQWSFDPSGIRQEFKTSLVLENDPVYNIDAFTESTIVFRRNTSDPGTIFKTVNPRLTYKLLDSNLTQEEQCYEVLLQDSGLVIVLRSASISLYRLPLHSESSATIELQPFARHTFQWRIDSARLTVHAFTKAIILLIRFNSGYPWPVNVIHQFSLSPSTDTLGYYPPALIQTISAPVRLFSVTDMALGAYGTALWVDTHVEDYFADGVMRGQRLAGRILSISEDEEVSMHNILSGVSSVGTTSVFGIREEDDWDRVALDERAVKVAVSTSDGRVMLMGYM